MSESAPQKPVPTESRLWEHSIDHEEHKRGAYTVPGLSAHLTQRIFGFNVESFVREATKSLLPPEPGEIRSYGHSGPKITTYYLPSYQIRLLEYILTSPYLERRQNQSKVAKIKEKIRLRIAELKGGATT